MTSTRFSTWALLALVALSCRFATAAERPNLVFLFADDQRADCIAALGNPHIKTPNLDRLVQRGFTFNNAYCMGSNSGAVCLPSRNMLLSGRAYFRFQRYASGEEPNWPDSLKAAGYYTYHHGKLGNTAREIHKRFDSSRYLDDLADRTCGEPGKEIVDAAIELLDARGGDSPAAGKPFFLYLAFANPHDPRVAQPHYMQQYQREDIPLPANYLPVHPFNNGEMAVRDERLAPWPRTPEVVREHLHDYYATITGLDHHIGRLLDEFDRRGLTENTIFIFSADHGLAMGSHGLFGKQSLYEHSMKAPLVLAGPGIPQGSSDALVYLLDLYPTVCDLLQVDTPPGLDGQSFAPVIAGKSQGVRDSLFLSYRDVQRAVRDDRWKLIVYPQINRTQLFDLASDPNELTNLADQAEHAERIAALTERMQTWQQRLGDGQALSSDQPQDASFTPPTEEDARQPPKKRRGSK